MTKARDLANASTALSAVSATELGYLDGVTSAVQTQLDAKQAANANVSTTELGYLDGVTSAIQTQLDAKIPKTLTTTTGDIIYASGANTPARLGIGAASTYLTSDGTVPSWGTISAGGMTLIATTNMSGSSVTVSSIPDTYKHLMVVFKKVYYNSNDYPIQFRFNSDTGSNYYWQGFRAYNATVDPTGSNGTLFEPNIKTRNAADNYLNMFGSFNLYNYTTTTPKGYDSRFYWADSGGTRGHTQADGTYYNTSAISSITVIAAGQSFSGGTMYTYGVS